MRDYREERPLEHPKAVEDLLNIIKSIVRDEIKKAKFNRMITAIVTTGGTTTASVRLLIDEATDKIFELKNKTGVTLVADDLVYVELINSSSSNMYIAIKK